MSSESSIFAEGGGAGAAAAASWTLLCQHGKNKHSVVIDPALTILNLKERLQELTGVSSALMKLMFKGMLKDVDAVGASKLKDGCKVMVVGNALVDILAATTAPKAAEGAAELVDDSNMTEAPEEPLHTREPHKKILAMGPIEGSVPGRADGGHEPLPEQGVHKVRTGPAGKEARLAFKFEGGMTQLLVQTKDSIRRQPYTRNNVRAVRLEEQIEEHPGYCIMSLQVGANEKKDKVYLYFVPCQYFRAIRDKIA